MLAKRTIRLGWVTLLWIACTPLRIPTAWGTAPPTPLFHAQEEGSTLYGGIQGGQPTIIAARTYNPYFYGRAHAGWAGQWQVLRAGITTWGSYGKGRLDYSDGAWEETFIAGHLHGEIGAAPRLIPDKMRLEFGLGAGAGTEFIHQLTFDSLGAVILDDTRAPALVPSLSLYTGVSYSLSERSTIGFRWNIIGLGTGCIFSYRYGYFQLYASTQPFPLILDQNPNWAVGIQGYLPLPKR